VTACDQAVGNGSSLPGLYLLLAGVPRRLPGPALPSGFGTRNHSAKTGLTFQRQYSLQMEGVIVPASSRAGLPHLE
jgi:hypothetical protein